MARKTNDKNRIRTTIEVKHEFSREEQQEKIQQLTSKMRQVKLKQEAIKAAAATAKAEVKALESDVSELSDVLSNGYEMRAVEAWVEFNRKKGTKRFYWCSPGRPENNTFIKEDAMTEDEYQNLPLGPKELEPTAPEPEPQTTTIDLKDMPAAV